MPTEFFGNGSGFPKWFSIEIPKMIFAEYLFHRTAYKKGRIVLLRYSLVDLYVSCFSSRIESRKRTYASILYTVSIMAFPIWSASSAVFASLYTLIIGSVFDFLRCTHLSAKSIFTPSTSLMFSLL